MKRAFAFIFMLFLSLAFIEAKEGCVVKFENNRDLKMLDSGNFVVSPVLVFDTHKWDFVDLDDVPKYQYATHSRKPYGSRAELIHFEQKANKHLNRRFFIDRMHISSNERYIFIFGYVAKKPITDSSDKIVDDTYKWHRVRGENHFRKVVCQRVKEPKKIVLSLRERNGFLSN